LARHCITLGKGERNTLRRSRIDTPHTISDIARHGLTFSTDFLTPPDQRYYDLIFDIPSSVSRKYVGRIALARNKAWSLHMKEISMVFQGTSEDGFPALTDAHYSAHWFRWTGERVVRAERRSRDMDLEEGYVDSYQPEMLADGVFAADFMATVGQFATVTSGDCETLIRDIQSFDDALRTAA
jgi:hypothetical protein